MDRAKEGYNCTIMAYGQTGSGKTHTMFGPPGCLTEAAVDAAGDGGIPDTWGLFPRAVLHMMQAWLPDDYNQIFRLYVFGPGPSGN